MDFSKFLGEVGLAELWNLMTAYVDGKLFVGTKAEYEAAAADIPVGTMIVITDEIDVAVPPMINKPTVSITTATAVLGKAKLGNMKLGKE